MQEIVLTKDARMKDLVFALRTGVGGEREMDTQ